MITILRTISTDANLKCKHDIPPKKQLQDASDREVDESVQFPAWSAQSRVITSRQDKNKSCENR